MECVPQLIPSTTTSMLSATTPIPVVRCQVRQSTFYCGTNGELSESTIEKDRSTRFFLSCSASAVHRVLILIPSRSPRSNYNTNPSLFAHYLLIQVEGCTFLPKGTVYHQRYRICAFHASLPVVMINGEMKKWCQQCGRFQVLEEFEGSKKSCRKKLEQHNEQRRRARERGKRKVGESSFTSYPQQRMKSTPPTTDGSLSPVLEKSPSPTVTASPKDEGLRGDTPSLPSLSELDLQDIDLVSIFGEGFECEQTSMTLVPPPLPAPAPRPIIVPAPMPAMSAFGPISSGPNTVTTGMRSSSPFTFGATPAFQQQQMWMGNTPVLQRSFSSPAGTCMYPPQQNMVVPTDDLYSASLCLFGVAPSDLPPETLQLVNYIMHTKK